MKTREQLITWLNYLEDGQEAIGLDRLVVLRKLLAERPYEPGEKIHAKVRDESDWQTVHFLCVDPSDPEYIVYYKITLGGISYWRCRFHRPLPKTTRVKPVPEEIIDDAKDARKAFRLVAETPSEVKGFKALKWLTNPENWEADNG